MATTLGDFDKFDFEREVVQEGLNHTSRAYFGLNRLREENSIETDATFILEFRNDRLSFYFEYVVETGSTQGGDLTFDSDSLLTFDINPIG